MPICTKHGTYLNDDLTMCGQCWRELQSVKTAERKSERKQFGKFKKKFVVSEKTKARDRLKKRLQDEWSKYMKEVYREMGLYYCWITGHSTLKKGIFGLHVSHYYAKGEIWQLWCDPVNSGLSIYDQNVNKPQNVTAMRHKMIEVWGEDRVKELDEKAEMYRNRIKAGIDPKYPTDIWLMGMIKEIKK